jgi:putative endonuclease
VRNRNLSSRAKRSAVEGSRSATKNVLMSHQNYFVYILTNADRHAVLYIGVTNELERRANEHSLGRGSLFAQRYNAHKLIYFEVYSAPENAVAGEKQLKSWRRQKKDALIGKSNPEWCNLMEERHALAPTGGVR